MSNKVFDEFGSIVSKFFKSQQEIYDDANKYVGPNKRLVESYVNSLDLSLQPAEYWCALDDYINRLITYLYNYKWKLGTHSAAKTDDLLNAHGSSVVKALEDITDKISAAYFDLTDVMELRDDVAYGFGPRLDPDTTNMDLNEAKCALVVFQSLKTMASALRKRLETTDGLLEELHSRCNAYIQQQYDLWNAKDPLIPLIFEKVKLSLQADKPLVYYSTVNVQNKSKKYYCNTRCFIHWVGDNNLFWSIDMWPSKYTDILEKHSLRHSPTGYFRPEKIDHIKQLGFGIIEKTVIHPDSNKQFKVCNMEWNEDSGWSGSDMRKRSISVYEVMEDGSFRQSNINSKAGKAMLTEMKVMDKIVGKQVKNPGGKKKAKR